MRKQDKTEKVIANIYCVYGEGRGGVRTCKQKDSVQYNIKLEVCRIVAIEE